MLRFCRILGAVVVATLALVTLTPVSLWMAARYAESSHLGPASAVVALGGGVVRGALGDPSLRRALEGIRLQRMGLAPLILFTGEPLETELRSQLAQELGVPPDAILTATVNTTHEEARAAAELLRPRGIRSVLLVSGSIHLTRARGAFEREGFEILPAPTDSRGIPGSVTVERLVVMRLLVREIVARWYYRATGYL